MSGSSEEHDMKPGIGPVISSGDVLTWEESQAMIPLVSSIVRDLSSLHPGPGSSPEKRLLSPLPY